MHDRCSKARSFLRKEQTSTRSFRSITPFTTRGRTTRRSENAAGNLSRSRFTTFSSGPPTCATDPEPRVGSYVNDGLLLQSVLGRDEQDGDETEEHRGEHGHEVREALGEREARVQCVRRPVQLEGPQDEEDRRDVEDDEDQGEHVVLEMKLDRRLALGKLPALVRQILQRGRVGGPEEAGGHEREGRGGQGYEKGKSDGGGIVQERHFQLAKKPP